MPVVKVIFPRGWECGCKVEDMTAWRENRPCGFKPCSSIHAAVCPKCGHPMMEGHKMNCKEIETNVQQ